MYVGQAHREPVDVRTDDTLLAYVRWQELTEEEAD